MWKESYRIGVDLIDMQHMELFRMVGNLLDVVQNGKGDKKDECISAISFLKDYTLQHFSDEEDYQRSIGYAGLGEHKMIHQAFVRDVLSHERKMMISDFHSRDVKDFMGTLIAWLVYHVAGADQLIVAKNKPEDSLPPRSPIDSYFYISTCDILNKMTGLNIKDVKMISRSVGDVQPTIAVQIGLRGDISGTVTYKYTERLAFDLIRSMASFSPRDIDEMVCSAMQEISNIISVRAVGMMASYGFSCNVGAPDIQVHPAFIPSREGMLLDTGMGILEMEADIKQR